MAAVNLRRAPNLLIADQVDIENSNVFTYLRLSATTVLPFPGEDGALLRVTEPVMFRVARIF